MKNACPTKVGGQAILEGLMMRGSKAIAVAIREPSGNIHLSVEPVKAPGVWKKIPIVRGVVSFVSSLVTGTSILMDGAEVLEKLEEEQGKEAEEPDKLEKWLTDKFGEKKAFSVMMYFSVVVAILMVVGLFILLPTAIMNLIKKAGVESILLLNLFEGLLRICMFILYILLISRMPDIKRVFQYHGAEHKTIHCYENGLELTPENAQTFYTLHPRCGTSFLMFVMIISLLVFSFFGWPDLKTRIITRILLIPVIAGISYEVLQFTGRHDSRFVQILSMPGIMLQKLTTSEPDLKQLEVAIAAMNAVLPSHEDPQIEVEPWVGELLSDGTLLKNEEETKALLEKLKK
ncbi:MAG: DUF1385 domain-containing protein [Firmicutes bacterium]|nr:DUF1385 domain-containing protein [Bacillota bacterium]MBR0481345.1 DUF1385 domain-containing protein [Bacillota bacterium]